MFKWVATCNMIPVLKFLEPDQYDLLYSYEYGPWGSLHCQVSMLKSQFTAEPCVLSILHTSQLEQRGKEMRSVNVFVFRLASNVEKRGNFIEHLALLGEKKSAYIQEDWYFISHSVFLGTS